MGTEALRARSRTDGLGSLVIRIAGAEKCRLRNRSIRSSPLIPGICWSTTRQPQGVEVACAQQFGSASRSCEP